MVLVLSLPGTAALAGAELVLENGQVLEGVEVVRKDDRYLLELESGKVLAIPAQLVAKVRLTGESKYTPEGKRITIPEELVEEDRDPEAPTAVRDAGPETLAGRDEAARPPRTENQLRVLGEQARFRGDLVDSSWVPESDWDFDSERQNNFDPSRWAKGPTDTRWRPRSAYRGSEDVLTPGDSEWAQSIVDPEWVPEDGFDRRNMSFTLTSGGERAAAEGTEPPEPGGFRRATYASSGSRRATYAGWRSSHPKAKSPGFGVFTVARIAGSPSTASSAPSSPATPATCAQRLFSEYGLGTEGSEPQVRVLGEGPLADLPVGLYEAVGSRDGERVRAVLAFGADVCRLVAGDLGKLLGIGNITAEHAVAWSVNAYNTVLAGAGGATIEATQDKVAYAHELVRVLEPEAGGGDDPVLLLRRDDLDRIAGGGSARCALGRRERRRQTRTATKEFSAGDTVVGVAGDVFTFHTWTRQGGAIARYSVYLLPDGRVTLQRTAVARHVGDHVCGG